jgi:hypothetical protein
MDELSFVSRTDLLLRESLLQVRHDVLHLARWTHSIYDWMRITYDLSGIGLDLEFELGQENPACRPEVQRIEPGPMSTQAALQPSRGQPHRLFPEFSPLLPSPEAFRTANTVPGIVHTLLTPRKATLATKSLCTPRSSCLFADLARGHGARTQGRRNALT